MLRHAAVALDDRPSSPESGEPTPLLAPRLAIARLCQRCPSLARAVRAAAPVLYLICALVVLAAIGLRLAAPDRVLVIDPASIHHDSGQAYSIRLRAGPASGFWITAAGDDFIAPRRSQLALYEDGRALAQGHAEHEDIRKLGGGRYSHWTRLLLFSSTDGTSPLAGMHTYTFRAPQTIPTWLQRLALACALALFLGALPRLRRLLAFPKTRGQAILLSVALASGATALAAHSLYGAGRLADLQPDSPGFLAPAAAALFEDSWDHNYARPFVYPAFAYLALRWGGTLEHLIVAQIAAYLLCALLIYSIAILPGRLVPRTRTRPGFGVGTPAGHLLAATAVFVYFSLSGNYLASVFFVAPEVLSSSLALAALWLCLKLTLDRDLGPAAAVVYALVAAVSAAALIGMKPALAALAALTLALAGWGLWNQHVRPRPAMIFVVCASMLALPIAVVSADRYLSRKYQDASAQLFGPVTAFCNNADVIGRALETPDSRASRLLGDPAAQAVAEFLREVRADESWAIQGFNGDACVYSLAAKRTEIERRYFGAAIEDVAGTYRRLLIASIADAPGLYLRRVSRQVKGYVIVRPVLDCHRGAPSHWAVRDFAADFPLVQRLLAERGSDPRGQTFPQPLLGEGSCGDLVPVMAGLHVPLGVIAIAGSALCFLRRRSIPRMLVVWAQASLICMGFWMSASLIVAMVHSFDIVRYVTVTFPIYVAMLASLCAFAFAFGYYLVRVGAMWHQRRLSHCIRIARANEGLPPVSISPHPT